jgi:ParB/RepB/Spo0J family partition protein
MNAQAFPKTTSLTALVVLNADLLRALRGGSHTTIKGLSLAIGRDDSNTGKSLKLLEAAGLIGKPDGEPTAFPALTDVGHDAVAALDRADNIAPKADASAEASAKAEAGYANLRWDQIVPDPANARDSFDRAELEGLADSIFEHGLQSKPQVRQPDASGQYQLLFGERRWRAWDLLILDGRWSADHTERLQVVAVTDEARAIEAGLIENEQRVDLNHIQRGRGYDRLADLGRSNEEIAALAGRSVTYVQQHRRLLRLDDDTQRWVASGQLTLHDALKLIPTVKTPEPAAELALDGEGKPEVVERAPAERPKATFSEALAAKLSGDMADLSPKERLVLIELAHKICHDGVDVPGKDYRGARVGQYWLAAECSALNDARLTAFINPGAGLGWLGTITEAGREWLRLWNVSPNAVDADDLWQARQAAHIVNLTGRYATRFLNPDEPAVKPAGAQAEDDEDPQAAEDAKALEAMRALIEAPITDREELRVVLATLGAGGRWTARSGDNAGGVYDANGEEICTVDVHRDNSDARAEAIGLLIAYAVNYACGFDLGEAQADPA